MAFLTETQRVSDDRIVRDVVPTITAGLYASGDALGGLLSFQRASLGPGRSGMIELLRVIDRAAQLAAMDLVLFTVDWPAVADNAVFDVDDVYMDHFVGAIPITGANYWNFADNATAVVYPVSLPFITEIDDTLYGQLVVRAAPTYAATNDLRVRLSIRRD